MSGKDLLAVLAMISPTFLLLAALIALSVVSSHSTVRDRAGEGEAERRNANKAPAGHEVVLPCRPMLATQKLMLNPWERGRAVKDAGASEMSRCNPSESDRGHR